jgi:hypothetical protein
MALVAALSRVQRILTIGTDCAVSNCEEFASWHLFSAERLMTLSKSRGNERTLVQSVGAAIQQVARRLSIRRFLSWMGRYLFAKPNTEVHC